MADCWLAAFAVDVTVLQGKGLFADEMHSLVKAFMAKLPFLSRQLEGNTHPHSNPERGHTINRSPLQVLIHVSGTAW